jgi:hypothetical protein
VYTEILGVIIIVVAAIFEYNDSAAGTVFYIESFVALQLKCLFYSKNITEFYSC